jgi:hypothetical protein
LVLKSENVVARYYAKFHRVKNNQSFSPNDGVELSMIRGLLESEGVNFYVQNDRSGSMEVGPRIDLINKKTVMVAPEDADRARHIITEFLESSIPEETGVVHQYTFGQKCRMILEAVLLCWFIPGRKRRKQGLD